MKIQARHLNLTSLVKAVFTAIPPLLLWEGGYVLAEPNKQNSAPMWIAEDASEERAPVWTSVSTNSGHDLEISAPESPLRSSGGVGKPLGFEAAQPQFVVESPLQDTQGNPDAIAQQPTDAIPSPEEVEALRQQLESYEKAPLSWKRPYLTSPAITMSIPSGYGADKGRFFTGLGASRTRIDTTDGSAAVGIGLGDARKSVGVQISYTAFSVSPQKFLNLFGIKTSDIRASDRPFGSGAFNIKVHRQFGNGWSGAVGADSIINIGGKAVDAFGENSFNELQGTYYAAVSKTVNLKTDASEPFSRLVLTAGAGTGRFLTFKQATDGKFHINPFASAALRVSPAINLIAEWSGNDLGIGASVVPFRRLPIVFTPAIRDLLGPDATQGPRFVMGVGLSF
jgi:hypothetical protein